VDDILYPIAEDNYGDLRTQFVLPKQVVKEVIQQVHGSVYNAHLGRKKTMVKIMKRMYRPKLREEIVEAVKEITKKHKLHNSSDHTILGLALSTSKM
jgi:hypothetical protein